MGKLRRITKSADFSVHVVVLSAHRLMRSLITAMAELLQEELKPSSVAEGCKQRAKYGGALWSFWIINRAMLNPLESVMKTGYNVGL